MASDHERAAVVPNEELCANALAHYERVSSAAHEWYSSIPHAIRAWYANPGDPLAGSEQRGAAAKYAVGNANAVQRQAESQPSPPPQRGAASSTPHPSAAPQVPTAPHGDSGLTGSGPAVAAPSAVEELDRSWLTIRAGQEMRVASHVVALRHARELDALRPAKRRLEALENSVRFYVTDWCVKLIYERAAQIEKEAK